MASNLNYAYRFSNMEDDIHSVLKYDNVITMIYGEAATGKTTIAKMAAIKYAQENKKVIYIDSEKGFSIDRFRQLAGQDYVKLLDNIIFFLPKSLQEQRKIMKELVPIIESGKISLVIIDTIGFYYRYGLKEDNKYANKSLDESIKIFNWVNDKGIPVIITNQVYSSLDNHIKNVGGNMLLDACKNVIMLEKNPRIMKIEKPDNKSIKFDIKEKGIELLD